MPKTCTPKIITYDPAECPGVVAYFADAANPTLAELEVFYAAWCAESGYGMCDGDKIVDTEGNVIATNYEMTLVRKVDQAAWCQRVNICDSGHVACCPTSNCQPNNCALPADQPFAIVWPAPHGFDDAKICAKQIRRAGYLAAALDAIAAKTTLPEWLKPKSETLEFDADWNASNNCGESEPITLPAGWWEITVKVTKTFDDQSKTKIVARKYYRVTAA